MPNLDRVADALAAAANSAYSSAGSLRAPMKDALNGTWLGHPLHPALTDIPVGAWTAALVLDAMGEKRAAKTAVGVGLAGALAAALSGLTDWLDTYGNPRRLGVVHAAMNLTATALYAGSFFARGSADALAVRLSTAGYAVVSLGALLGGVLSLDLQIGVNHAHAAEPPDDEVDVGAVVEIPDGGMRRVDAQGYPVLLARRGREIYAMGAVCAHQGGPLDEGTLQGDIVTCPWHGSQFCVRDGRIVHGPTAYPQPAFAVRISEDRVFISHRA